MKKNINKEVLPVLQNSLKKTVSSATWLVKECTARTASAIL